LKSYELLLSSFLFLDPSLFICDSFLFGFLGESLQFEFFLKFPLSLGSGLGFFDFLL
jgi:hypothetical protein